MYYNAHNSFSCKYIQRFAILVALFLCVSLPSEASSKDKTLRVPVRFKIINGDLSGARIIIENLSGFREALSAEKNMECALLYNQKYILTFTKPGYVTKKIEFDTSVPDDRHEQGFVPYPIGVRLFPQQDDVNIVVFNQPVAKIQFSAEIDDFDFDVDYTKSVQSLLSKAEEELASKAKSDAKLTAKNSKKNSKSRNKVSSKKKATISEDKISPPKTNNNKQSESQLSASTASKSGIDPNILTSGGTGDSRPPSYNGFAGSDNRPDSNAVEFGYDERMQIEETVNLKDILFKEKREARRTIYFLIVEEAEKSTVYKKVVWDWGGVYCFVNETTPITKEFYDTVPYLD